MSHYKDQDVTRESTEPLLGAQEAARILGVHRSTLHIAIHKQLLIPDARTQGGHVRFRRETLEAFREQVMGLAVTSPTSVFAPMESLAELAHLLAERQPAEEVASAAIQGITHALHGIDGCIISVVVPEPHDRLALHVLARYGLPENVIARFERLRTTYKFATTAALRTLEPQICENTATEPLHTGTAEIRRIWQLGAYIALPLVKDGEALGVLLCVSRHPRAFSERERTFLRGIADMLTVALAVRSSCPAAGGVVQTVGGSRGAMRRAEPSGE